MSSPRLTSELIRRMAGDIDDDTVAAIEALNATPADLETALMWLGGAGEVPGKEQRPLAGHAAQIYDMLLEPDEEEVGRAGG